MSVRVEVGTCIAVCKVFTAVHALTCCRGCGAVNSLLDRALVSTYVDASPFLTPCHGDCDGSVPPAATRDAAATHARELSSAALAPGTARAAQTSASGKHGAPVEPAVS